MRKKTFKTKSAEETRNFAKEVAHEIKEKANNTFIALSGNLGAGKTTFVQGLMKELGIRQRAVSPTFIIYRAYRVPKSKKRLYHVDAYRLKKSKDLLDLGFQKIITDPRAIILLEWPEKVLEIVPRSAMGIEFIHGEKENERLIKVKKSFASRGKAIV